MERKSEVPEIQSGISGEICNFSYSTEVTKLNRITKQAFICYQDSILK